MEKDIKKQEELTGQQVHHHHHHHHHHHGMDDAESFKRHQLRSQRIRKMTVKIGYYTLTALAILVILAVFYVYTH